MRKRFFTILIIVVIAVIISSDIAISASNNNRIPVLIGFRRIPGPSEQALVQRAGGQLKYSYTIVPAIAASVPVQALQGLANNPNVTYIEQDAIAYATADTLPWGVNKIDAELVHPGNTGSGIKVAIIDTGIDYKHADLSSNVKGGYDFVNKDSDPFDDNGHGTHVAGTVAALWNNVGVIGVAPSAYIYAIKVLDASGSGSYSNIIAGIDWCSANGIHVINMSLGGSTGSTALQTACDNAYNKGILIVASAGNSGRPNGSGDTVGYPAKYNSVIAVAATDQSDKRASWSSTGPAVELAAPGVSILSTYPNNQLTTMSGTSMASPHVAGTAALVWAANPTWTNLQIRNKLRDTAVDLGVAGRDSFYGYGLVDAFAAAGATVINNPPVASFSWTTNGLSVAFTDTSTDNDGSINLWNWSFGDGTTSTSKNPTNSYASAGTYIVTLTVTDNEGATDTVSASISVSEPGSVLDMYSDLSDIQVVVAKTAGKNIFYKAIVTVTISNSDGTGINGAFVSGHWSGDASDYDSGYTNSNGTITFESDAIRSGSSFTFTIDNVVKDGYIWAD